MKKHTGFLLFLLFSLSLLTGCAKNRNENVHFIHALCFSQDGDSTKILAVSEKQSGDESKKSGDGGDYIILSADGENIDSAAESFTEKYGRIYFATSEIYIFKSNSSIDFIKQASRQLCDSSIFPVKSSVILTAEENAENFLSAIKNGEDIKKLLHLSKDGKTNIVAFFADVNEGKTCKVPTIGLDAQGKLSFIDKTDFGEDTFNE